MKTGDHTELGRDRTTKEDAFSVAELLEEVRQLRVSLRVYRHLVDRLLTDRSAQIASGGSGPNAEVRCGLTPAFGLKAARRPKTPARTD